MGETSPKDSCGRTVLYSSSQRSVSSRTWVRLMKRQASSTPSRWIPLNRSTKAFCVGLPGWVYSMTMLRCSHQATKIALGTRSALQGHRGSRPMGARPHSWPTPKTYRQSESMWEGEKMDIDMAIGELLRLKSPSRQSTRPELD